MTDDVRDLYGADHLGPVTKFLRALDHVYALEAELENKRQELAVVLTQKANLERELDSLRQDYKEAIRERS